MSYFQSLNLADVIEIYDNLRKPLNSRERVKMKGEYPYYGASGIVDYVNDYVIDGEYLLVSEDGENLRSRKTPIAFIVEGKNWVNNHAHIIKANEKAVTKYLCYVLNNLDLNPYITGAVQPKLSQQNLRIMSVSLPSKEVQEKVVNIIDAIDKKIYLNSRISERLENMAMAIYKHWFVDFGPFQDGEFVESELGMIPKGWKVGGLKNIANLLMGQSPKSEFYNENGEGLPFHQGVTNFGERFPLHKTYCTQELRVANEGDFLVSVRAPVGRLNITDRKIIIGRGLSAISSIKGYSSFLFYTLKRLFAVEDQYGSGTVFNSVTKKEMEELPVFIPQEEQVKEFEGLVAQFDALIAKNTKETNSLISIRDYLLPRLLSGEINVSEIKEKIEEVLQ